MNSVKTEPFGIWVEQVMSSNAKGDYQSVGTLKPDWVAAAEAANFAPVSTNILVRDHDVKHSFRDAKAEKLPLDWYYNLPEHLINPHAVIFDQAKPKEASLLLIYCLPNDRAYKLVVRINYFAKLNGEKKLFNIVETGHMVGVGGIKGQIDKCYILIDGSL